jgi:hypothetical protein
MTTYGSIRTSLRLISYILRQKQEAKNISVRGRASVNIEMNEIWDLTELCWRLWKKAIHKGSLMFLKHMCKPDVYNHCDWFCPCNGRTFTTSNKAISKRINRDQYLFNLEENTSKQLSTQNPVTVLRWFDYTVFYSQSQNFQNKTLYDIFKFLPQSTWRLVISNSCMCN